MIQEGTSNSRRPLARSVRTGTKTGTRQRTSRCRHEEMRREPRLTDPHATPSSFSTVEKSGGPAGQTPWELWSHVRVDGSAGQPASFERT